MLYSQCTIEKKTESGKTTQVTWLPAKYAVKGKVLKLKDDGDKWQDGWVVMQVGDPSERPPDWKKLVRQHRKDTGDALPKRREES